MDNGKAPHTVPSELRWTVHPLRDEPPAKSGLLIAIILGLTVAVSISFNTPAYGFLTLALLTASLSRYFLPTRYALGETEILIAHLSARRKTSWQQIRRYTLYPDGIFLSPFDRPHRLDTFRGFFLRFGSNQNEVLCYVRNHFQPP